MMKAMTCEEGKQCGTSRCRHGSYMGPSHPCRKGCAHQVSKPPVIEDVTQYKKGDKIKVTGNLTIDMNNFSELSRMVGYYNHKCNIDQHDQSLHAEYEHMRSAQLDLMRGIIDHHKK
jgi:hypothetical protein